MMDYQQTHPAATMSRSRRPRQVVRHRIHLHERFVPLLLALTLLSSLGLAGLAYLAARNAAMAEAQTRTAQGVRTLRQLLADQGGAVTQRDGQLVIVGGQQSDGLVLNGDTTLVDRARALFDFDATIYQLQGPALTAIATSAAAGDTARSQSSARALGDTLSGSAYDALLGACSGVDTRACHHTYTGLATIRGRSYVVTDEPLYDGNGALVGALGVALPLETALAPATQQAVLLLLVGMLIWLVGVVVGYWVFDRLAKRTEATLARQLDGVSQGALALSDLARMQVARTSRQEAARRQVVEQAQALDTLARNIEQVQMSLRDSASELWAEMSQPGAAPDPAKVLRSAQRAAVVAARMGTGAMQVHEFCRQIVTLLRQSARDFDAVADHGREMDARAMELRALVEQAEIDREENVPGWLKRLHALPWLRKRQLAETTLAQAQSHARTRRTDHPHAVASGMRPTTGQYRAVGQYRTTGQYRATGQYRVTGQYPIAGQGSDHTPRPAGAGPMPPQQGGRPQDRAPLSGLGDERGMSGWHPRVVGPDVPGMSGWTGAHRGALQRGPGAQSYMPNPRSQIFGPSGELPYPPSRFPNPPSQFPTPLSQYPNPPSQLPNLPGRFPNPISEYPNPPSLYRNSPSQFPNPPSQFAFGYGGMTGAPFGVGQAGQAGQAGRVDRWHVPRPPQAGPPPEQPPGALGLPSLADDDHIPPNWLTGEHGSHGSQSDREA